jgi:hypothetical protein
MRRLIVLATVLVLGIAPAASAQKGGPPMVSGRVFDDSTGCPLAGVFITATATAHTMTNAAGRYYLWGVPATPFTLTARLNGFVTLVNENVIAADSTMRVDFSLLRAPGDASKGKPLYPTAKCMLEPRDSTAK